MPDRYRIILEDSEIEFKERLLSLHQETLARFESGDLVLYWQEIRPIRGGEMGQYELLLRQRSPSGSYESAYGLLLKLEEIPASQDGSTAIAVIDRVVICKAIELLATHPEIERLWVNVSATSIAHNGTLASYILRAALSDRILPKRLAIEAGERACLDDVEHARSFFAALKANGCPYALDDFGATGGGWGLKSIEIFQPTFVKLDQAIVWRVGEPEVQAQIKAIADSLHSYGGEVIAECVENELQADICLKLGLDYIQGFYVGMPTEITIN